MGVLGIVQGTTLTILELSLSFDNAVVNALILVNMPPIWRKRFLTWGMLIAVFGVRLIFPILIASLLKLMPEFPSHIPLSVSPGISPVM